MHVFHISIIINPSLRLEPCKFFLTEHLLFLEIVLVKAYMYIHLVHSSSLYLNIQNIINVQIYLI